MYFFAFENLTCDFHRSRRNVGTNLQQAARQTTVSRERHDEANTRLHRHWLLLARIVWIAIFVLTLVVFCANLLVGNYGLVTTILLVAVTSVWFAVGGVTSWEALQLLRGLRGANFVAFDIVEVLPAYDPIQITALLAANVAYEFLSLLSYVHLRSHLPDIVGWRTTDRKP